MNLLSLLTMSPYMSLETWHDFDIKRLTQLALFTGTALVACYNICSLLYSLFFSPLRSIPGPFLARATRWWEYVKVVNGDSHQEYVRLHEKYGLFCT